MVSEAESSGADHRAGPRSLAPAHDEHHHRWIRIEQDSLDQPAPAPADDHHHHPYRYGSGSHPPPRPQTGSRSSTPTAVDQTIPPPSASASLLIDRPPSSNHPPPMSSPPSAPAPTTTSHSAAATRATSTAHRTPTNQPPAHHPRPLPPPPSSPSSSSSSYPPSHPSHPRSPLPSRPSPLPPSRAHLQSDSYPPIYLSPSAPRRPHSPPNHSRSDHRSPYSRSIPPNAPPSPSRSLPRSRSQPRDHPSAAPLPASSSSSSPPPPSPSPHRASNSSSRPPRRSRSYSPSPPPPKRRPHPAPSPSPSRCRSPSPKHPPTRAPASDQLPITSTQSDHQPPIDRRTTVIAPPPSITPINTFQNYRPTFFFRRIPIRSSTHPDLPGDDPSPGSHRLNSPADLIQASKPITNRAIPKSSNGSALTKKHFVGVSSIESYELIEKLGEGTFGEVFKAIYRGQPYARKQKLQRMDHRIQSKDDPDTLIHSPESSEDESATDDGLSELKRRVRSGMVVALKRIIVHNELDGLPITALREIRILKSLDHPNIVPVVDLAYSDGRKDLLKRGNTYMVFPYIDHDLAGLLENKSITFSVSQIKLYSKQLLLGTAYLHRNKILHRDLKAANLLISNAGQLMIADFGLARSIEQQHNTKKREYTNCVVTRWYRPPEILLGNRRYGTPVDMWGVGCVIAEMFKGGPILTGSSDVNQCELIFRLCGSPTPESMPGWDQLPGCDGVRSWSTKPRRVREEFERHSPEVASLLDQLLVLDPSQRLTAEEALDHDWFWTDPLAIDPAKLPHYEASHEYDRRKKQDHSKKTHQHQIASFTEMQGSAVSIKPTGSHSQVPRSHRLAPSGTNSKGPPTAGSNANPPLPFPDRNQSQSMNSVRGRTSHDPTSQARRDGFNPAGNPSESYPSDGMMAAPNDSKGSGDHRHRYHHSSRSMMPDSQRGGPLPNLTPHLYPGPPRPFTGGGIQSNGGNPASSMVGYGPASLPLRPVSTYGRGPYDSARPTKLGPPPMISGGVNGPVGGMAPSHSYGQPDPYLLMTGPSVGGVLAEHATIDERGLPANYAHSSMRNGFNGGGGGGGGSGYRSRPGGNGRADGRSRAHHDRWSPEATPQLGPMSGSGAGVNGLSHPNNYSYQGGRMMGGDRRPGGSRRYRNSNGGHDHRGPPSTNYPPYPPRNHHHPRSNGMNAHPPPPNPYSSHGYSHDSSMVHDPNNNHPNQFHPPPPPVHPQWDKQPPPPSHPHLDFQPHLHPHQPPLHPAHPGGSNPAAHDESHSEY